MTRRCLLLSCLAAGAAGAEDDSGVLEIFEPLASALSTGDVEGFMKPFDRQMPNLAKLRDNVTDLMELFDITSSVELIRSDSANVELDWYMELRRKEGAGVTERRRQNITAIVEKKRIRSIAPLEFFAPTAN
ncbi:MAG TPA: hypothetical protein VK604_05355 [Bryobacteraceae bacterium]|nr:hypothetical protein [Bryobacteraceae bacterium]